jgi:putative flippase GtrA
VDLTRRSLMELSRTPTGRKALRYSAVSVVSIIVSQLTLFVTFDVYRLFSAAWCQVIATAAGTVPAYTLNRYWAWGKRGRSDLLREVLPFWAMAFIGLAFSTLAVDLASDLGNRLKLSHLGIGLLVQVASLGSYGVLWVGKFMILNKILFVERPKPGNGQAPTDEDPVVVTGQPV